MTIWKFPIEVTDEQRVSMPVHAKILHIAMQSSECCLWAQVEPEAPKCDRTIRIFGTGHPMPDDPGAYLGTFMLHGGSLVFHAYEAAH